MDLNSGPGWIAGRETAPTLALEALASPTDMMHQEGRGWE